MKERILEPYDKVLLARKNNRPLITDYIKQLFWNFFECSGDRLSGEDLSILGGIAMFHDRPITVIGQKKGKTTEENIACNFGMTSPSGYRKAIRLMKQAEKFKRPVVTFVDTPGAYPGMEAEEKGQSIAIAESLACMSTLKVPTIAIVTGEGNSGGALAIGVADRVYMLENAVYCILSPEGFASILFKDASKAREAAKHMKLTAQELLELGLIDGIIPEDKSCFKVIHEYLKNDLAKLSKEGDAIVKHRYEKYRALTKQAVE